MNIVLLGSGNVATNLALALKAAGENIVQVFSPNLENAKAIAKNVGSKSINSFSEIDRTADLYIVSVKDDAIAGVAKNLKGVDGLIVHTSGTTDINILSSEVKHAGVFYPLQTFSKSRIVDFKTIPLCLEASDHHQLDILTRVAEKLSDKVYVVNGDKRKVLHLAAVFACNFANHLYALSHQILTKNDLNFDLIKPLITETADKVLFDYPENVQTGPAIRRDESTINKHLAMLSDLPELQEIYQTLSNSIKLVHK
ncbi:Rossmann-like and DUF2520 domain-containing protein [Pedobacter sp. Leaf176]|uniref:Rossmann-like and DUF2520 domain-containing protein n=1 Tax=Pedobacter sp. Leaf176 TaxID=1736286 RepID=UPI0006FAFA06|nr:Rossmann-like and DUF2520 domain-containing protein [Pedobacter sp. Leaf176]KQR70513.1 oxidoreductase [Pedobacter sp. Leaf176]